ncbi:MAG: hypothetical protein LAT65_00900 [Saccharospirillum sp.]|nr:hypothetical protein [Saccharospirillum sp.]
MKARLRQLFSPLLNYFEAGEGEYHYRKLNRSVLVGVGILLLVLAAGSFASSLFIGIMGAIIPIVIFLSGSIVCLVIGVLGNDRAVAKIWGNK